MKQQHYIPMQTLCTHYNIEIAFMDALHQMGLIHIRVVNHIQCIHRDQIGDLEKIMRLHNELNLNLEAIDVIFNLLEKEQALRRELTALKNRLRLYEQD